MGPAALLLLVVPLLTDPPGSASLAVTGPAPVTAAVTAPVDFAAEVRPLLSDRCFACHGPDDGARQAGLRLDRRVDALAERRGGAAIVAGSADSSALLARLRSDDPERRMPPPGTRRPLSEAEVERLAAWIDQGAEYVPHWSFQPPVPAERSLSADADAGLLVDHFIRRRLADEGLPGLTDLSAPAELAVAARRTALALTGLPPTPERVEALGADVAARGEPAWVAYVDELLHDPGYGEHWARWWLDLARYADTKGYEADRRRTVWPWRDWVVAAFDSGMPFDRFTVEQLAGDLLPEATPDQRLATAFHRNTMTNDEGGTDDEEFRAAAVADRVDTTMEVWTGLTAACARCHTHKFDPLSQREYFQLYAVFDQTADADRMDEAPLLELPDGETATQLALLDAQADAQRQQLARWFASLDEQAESVGAGDASVALDGHADSPLEPWMLLTLDDALPLGAEPDGETPFDWYEPGEQLAGDDTEDAAAAAADADADADADAAADAPRTSLPVPRSGARAFVVTAPGPDSIHQRFFTGAREPLEIEADDWLVASFWIDPADPPRELMLQWHTTDGSWEHRIAWGDHVIPWGAPDTAGHRHVGAVPEAGLWIALQLDPDDVDLPPGGAVDGWAFSQVGGRVVWDRVGLLTTRARDPRWRHDQQAWEQRVRAGFSHGVPSDVLALLRGPGDDGVGTSLDEAGAHRVREHFLTQVWEQGRAATAAWRERLITLDAERQALRADVPRVPVLEALPDDARRETRLHVKGDFRNLGEAVTPDVPEALPPWPADQPRDRLGLAAWLTAPEHPLTARVLVNRVWERFFGAGLVATSADFGAQGERPSHPALLDALAVDLLDHGWDLRHLLRRLVLSRTWRQSSRLTAAAAEADPQNRLLARAPRVRLDGESLRDQALAVCGLLDRSVGGPPVFPAQPEGVWRIVYNGDSWQPSEGADSHRRSLYTFWRRTSPYPAYTTFDAPSREVCVSRRLRTNTPLQALVTLNDPVFVEAAQALARRVLRERPGDTAAQIERSLRLALLRAPGEAEVAALVALVADERARLAGDRTRARTLAGLPADELSNGDDPVELGALTVMANVVLNLDELVMPP